MESLMKIKWVLCLLLILNINFFSCSNLVDKKKMYSEDFAKIFKDLEYLNVKYELENLNDSTYKILREEIFKKNNLSEDDYSKELNYYINNLSDFELLLKEFQAEIEDDK